MQEKTLLISILGESVMKTLTMILLLSLGFVISTHSQNSNEYVQGQVLIKFTAATHAGLRIQSSKGSVQTSKPEINSLFTQLQISRIESLHPSDQNTEAGIRFGLNRTYVAYFERSIGVENAINILRNNLAIEIAEPNRIYHTCTVPNDPSYSNQWGLPKIQVPAAWDLALGSSDIRIAVLDIGFKLDHADLSSKFHSTLKRDEVDISFYSHPGWTSYSGEDYTVPDSDPSVPADPLDVNQHGTHVTGIAGASTNNSTGVAGVGWNNMIVPVRCGAKAQDPNLVPSSIIEQDDWIRALDWVRVNNAAKIVNMSFGRTACGGSSSIENDAIQAALNTGIALVAAAGNRTYDPKDTPCERYVMYPAAYSGVIAVGATNYTDEKTSFSNYGWNLSVMAPGLDIYSTYFDGAGNSTYQSLNGTSMASPFVAGLAGLILSVNSNLTPSQIRSIICQSADDLGYIGFDTTYGFGRINAFKAITLTLRNYGGTVTSNITIPAGETWTLSPGITWNFVGNYKLRVEGKLIANGTSSQRITFTRSGGQWYGIEFYNGNSGSSISYATIENAQYGVYSYGTDVTVSYSTIRYNTNGAYISGYPNSFSWNLFHDNTYGVQCAGYGDANIQPNNVLRWNSWGVYGDATSVPNLGSYIGYNSIYSTDYYDVYSTYSGTISARGNWWGSYPANPPVTTNVDYSSELSVDPNGWAGKIVKKDKTGVPLVLTKFSGTQADEPGMKEVDQAYELLLNENYEGALSLFQAIAIKYQDSFAGGRALVFADRILEKLGRDSKANLIEAVNRSTTSKVAGIAKSLLVGKLVKEGNYKDAMSNAIALVGNTDKSLSKDALYNAGNIAWYRLGDKSAGREYFRKLIAAFPDDPLSISAQATLGEWSGNTGPKQQTVAKTVNAEKFVLQNFPNPFNPATRISYSVPQDAFVSLKVFDVLGREVATLVNEVKNAGAHQATFNASSLPSGVYLYRLEAAGKSLIQKMLLLK